MSRFSASTVIGYNRSVIESSGLKPGDKIRLNDDNKYAWLIRITDNHLEIDFNREDGSLSIPAYYDKSDLHFQSVHCASIEGISPENITLTSQNKSKYEGLERELENAFDCLTSLGAEKIDPNQISSFPFEPLLALVELKVNAPALYPRQRSSGAHYGFLCIIEGSTLPEFHDHLIISTDSLLGPVLSNLDKDVLENFLRDCPEDFPEEFFSRRQAIRYFFCEHFKTPDTQDLGYLAKNHIHAIYDLTALDAAKSMVERINTRTATLCRLVENNAQRIEIDPNRGKQDAPSGPAIIEFNDTVYEVGNSSGYGTIAAIEYGELDISCSEQTQDDYKALKDKFDCLSCFSPLENIDLYDRSIKAIYTTSGMTAEPPIALQMHSRSIPYLISNQPNGALPDMTDFSLERVGSVNGGWISSSTIKAGRALAEGEVLSVFLIDRQDGEIRKIDYPAQKGKLAAEHWPKAFADHLVAAGEPMTAGSFSGDNSFSTTTTPLRLWSPARYRAFSTAPFAANLVQALACDESFALTTGATLCLQVRDLTSQTLYEHHFFTPTATQAGTQWSKALCEQINRDSRLLRAGVRDDCSVTPAEHDNAFWVPQCAELAVTLTETRWWQSQAVQNLQRLEEGRTVQAWVYDAFSHHLLAHHEWTPSGAQRAAGKWHQAWANALNASSVSPYLRAATHSPQTEQANGTDLYLWQRGDALRIFTTLPDAGNRLPGPTLQSAWKANIKDEVLVTVRHPFSRKPLHHALFKPQDVDTISDRDTWLQALADFLKAQAWPEVQVGASDEPLSVPRLSELQVLLENVSDGKTESDGDNLKHLLELDDLPAEQARFTVTTQATTVRVDVHSLNGELQFRLNQRAYDKGYRVAACTPRTSELALWPVDVTDTQITWAGPIDNGVYDLYLAYPESARDHTALTVGHIGAFHPSHFWHGVQAVEFTPPASMKAYDEISFLCEDYANTNQSEVFDTSPHDRNGVDERSGLFHAHYPITILQGLLGLGPVCDLSIHYSALRANEAGLGDGWAWRFSSIITSSTQENDHRQLTLADGAPILFSDEQWTQLGTGQAIKTRECRVSCTSDYSQFTLDFPSGRQEILSKPAAPGSDEIEPNDAFRKAVLAALKAIKAGSEPDPLLIPEHWTQGILAVIFPYGYLVGGIIDYAEARKAWREHANTKELNRRIALYERPFVQLLPSRIVSQYGEALDLQWKRQKGQFLLMSIKSGATELFSAEYVNPEAKAGSQVHMQLWPGTPEAFKVELTLEHYLLRTLKRERNGSVVQRVDCGYDDDPALDRVLCRLEELDGSVECVQYVKHEAKPDQPPALPKAVLHALLPGRGQQNHINRYTYTGSFQNWRDQIAIVAVQSGAHASVVHDLHAFGRDTKGTRICLLRGSASAQAHWLEFYLQHEQTTATYRYTGCGDELAEIIKNIVTKIKAESIEVTANASAVERRTAVLQLLWRYSTKNRERLHGAIKHMLSLSPKAERECLGKTLDATTIVTDAQGNPRHLHVKGSHKIYYCYYGEQRQSQIVLGSVPALSAVPTLECPVVPAYASAPLMAEYQCDDFGNPQGLKLYGYRNVTRAGREYLELAEIVIVDGIRGTLVNDTLDQHSTWALTGKDVLWHQISTTTSVPASKKTTSEQSKVKEWSITSQQTTHHGGNSYTLTNVQQFIDNPTQPGIEVIVSATTPAGTAQVSKELRSRYSRRALQKVENGLETHWERDASGRVTQETRYRLASGSNRKTARKELAEHIVSIYTDSNDKTTVERTFKDGSQSLSQLDGLQRDWLTAWRRSATDDYVPLEEHCFTGLDDACVLGSWAWDYLPGGQAVRKGPPLPGLAGKQLWMAQETRELTQRSATVEADTLSATRRSARVDATAAEKFTEALFAILACIDTEDPLAAQAFTLHRDGSSYTSNTIRAAYEQIMLAAEIHNITTTDHYKLIKYIQYLSGLTDLKGIEDADEWIHLGHWIASSVTEEKLSKFEATSDDFDIVSLFALANSSDNEELEITARSLFQGSLSTDNFLSVDSTVQLTERQGLGTQCLSKRTTISTAKTDGTFQRSVQWADDTDTQHLQIDQHYDANGQVISHTRTLGEQTLSYTLERDILGRVTKVTRPDTTTIERAYHGFSNRVSTLTVDGNVVATQAVNDRGELTTRTVGNREYRFDQQTVTLPDKTQLQQVRTANGERFEANGSALYSETHPDGSTVVQAAPGQQSSVGWRHTLADEQVPGCRKIIEKTPRGTVKGTEWQSLRGQRIAALRADGHTQRMFLDSEGRMLRSCQAHEDVLYHYDELGHLQARQVHALTGAGQWQVHSEHDSFNRESARTFLRNGVPCFRQQMTWRGDGRLESKASYQDGELLRTERFTYDLLDRLESYVCDTTQAALCPQDGNGTPIKAQTFTWDSQSNLTSWTNTPYEGATLTQSLAYATSDPTRLTSLTTGEQVTSLDCNSNGQLSVDGQQRQRAYNAAGQLSQIKNANGALFTRYEYDGLQRLAAQYDPHHQTTYELRYDGDELIGQVRFDQAGKITGNTSISPGLAQYDGEQVRWLIDDPQVGIAGQVCDTDLQLAPLLPFGEGAALDGLISGYNGMRRDPVTGQYHPGNGYRSYDPELRRFTQPDWLSPFGEGGINDSAYCPDPVNQTDLSGAIMLSRWGQDQELANYAKILRDTKPMPVGGRWRGLMLSAVLTVVGIAASVMTGGAASVFFVAITACSLLSFGFEVASVLTEESNPELSRKLGYASLVFAVASLAQTAVGLIKKAPGLIKSVMRSMRQIGKRLSKAKLDGRVTSSIVRPRGYAWEQLGSMPSVSQTAKPAHQGLLATLKAVGSKLFDYIAEAPFKNLKDLRYARMGYYGTALRQAHRLNNFATRSRQVSAGAWIIGKVVEGYLVQGSVRAVIAFATNDVEAHVTPWSRYFPPKKEPKEQEILSED
ncbi:RHS repeat-associated core domain-containing protein [Pseudomonas muyukensis]|uniref:N-acetylglucosamine binding protein A domain-containing protein n=1 Tax=Pseudomonas muyukensis TaxID=2842357 RepID=A0ABX8M5S2_9PSED|nr:RHS repeat-associated core domain-containing protein [Pseudomonas muyukensis]QXH33594.1 hypothetical protein KSS95_15580 [Pseudomonas muyukensis]